MPEQPAHDSTARPHGEDSAEGYRWVPWDRARRIAYDAAERLPSIWLPLPEALGETLSEPITALMPVPHFASAAIDGWAVAGTGPWQICTPQPAETDERLLLTLPPDRRILPVVELEAGQATPVTVGAAVPWGTTAVLSADRARVRPAVETPAPDSADTGQDEIDVTDAQEARDAQQARDAEAVVAGEQNAASSAPHAQDGDLLEDATPSEELAHNQDVRAQGEELDHGDVLAVAGRRLNPALIGLAASAGHDTLPVLRRPRVTVLLGSADVLEDGIPGPGQVRDVLGVQLPAVLHELGASVDQVRRVHDGAQGMFAAFSESPSGQNSVLDARAEIVVTTGGTGHGEDDHVRAALRELGARPIIDGLAQEPAHGVILARLPEGGPVVLALPGSPLSAMTGLLSVGHALIAGATGYRFPDSRPATCGARIPGDGRVHVIPGYLQDGRVLPEPAAGPAMLSGLAHAEVLMVVPEHGVEAGRVVQVLDLPWRGTELR